MQSTTAAPVRLELIDDAPQASRELSAQQQHTLAVPESSPAGLMLAAMAKGASLAEVEKMMDLQERWEKREAEKAFRDDFAAFRGENIIIPKTKRVDRGKAGSFDQAEFDEVCRRLSPALSRHGFGFRHDQRFGLKAYEDGTGESGPWVWVTCFLEHKLGHRESLALEGPPGDLSANTAVQNMQATASYLKRQSLLAITGTATGGEDDEAKLRKKPAQEAGTAADESEALLSEGRKAADRGMKALTEWWGSLTPSQRSELTPEFGAMRRDATRVDHEAGRG